MIGDFISIDGASGSMRKNKAKEVTAEVIEQCIQDEQEQGSGEDLDREDALRIIFQKRCILPLPGQCIQYPPNMKAAYTRILGEDQLSLTLTPLTDQDRSIFSAKELPGDYRKIIVLPGNVEHFIVNYTDLEKAIIPHPFETNNSERGEQMKATEAAEVKKDENSRHTLKALRLKFQLPSSAYATMAIRELTKTSTHLENQIQLNEQSLRHNNTSTRKHKSNKFDHRKRHRNHQEHRHGNKSKEERLLRVRENTDKKLKKEETEVKPDYSALHNRTQARKKMDTRPAWMLKQEK